MVWPCRIRWLFFVILRVRVLGICPKFAGRRLNFGLKPVAVTRNSLAASGQWPVASDVLQSFACECDSGPSSADKRGFPGPWQLVAASSMAPPSSLRPGPGPAVAGPAKPNSSCLSESSRHHFEPRPPPRLSHPDLDPGSSCPISPDQKPRVSPTNPAARRAAQHRPSAPRASTSSPPPPTSCRKT